MQKVQKLIKVFEDGRKEELQEHGVVVEIKGKTVKMDLVGTQPIDIVKATVGLVDACLQLELGEVLDMMLKQTYGEVTSVNYEKLQADNGNPGQESTDKGK